MTLSTVSLPSGLLVATARRTMSVSVTIPTNCFPFFTSRDPTRAVRIVLAALTIELFGPMAFGRFVMICETVDMVHSFRRERDPWEGRQARSVNFYLEYHIWT